MQQKLLDKMAALSVASRSRLSELAQRDGLTHPPFQLRVLSVVGRFPEQHQQALMQKRGWDKGQVARAFKDLERQGLIRRCGDSTPRRITQVALTAEGQGIFERLEQIRDELMATTLSGFSTAEERAFETLMTRALDNIIEAPPIE
ncbi:hypothetical protein BTW10_16205 [Chromohalobacter japonicus]|uniref:HTH marR-type domain-containing protein n=1 Tax=Chromohalobacter japonicus TaxID=223900 RepID=A0A1Q8T8Y6_9GAMM|nr:MarR family winged helix-turn-helix transcriptional regulator [Chromohalobacter japonicus]OLO10140.1 hypothetical protein BTW10_16205 [Chromohalobacter japonicus]